MPSTASPILVRCSDPALKASLQTWLVRLSLDAPPGLVLDVVVTNDTLSQNSEVIFEQPDLRFARGPGGRGLTLEWEQAPAQAVVTGADTTASIRLSPEAVRRMDLCTRTFLFTVLIV